MPEVILLAIAGALGTVSRYVLGNLVYQISGDAAWGTWVVNIIGCFLFGLVAGLAEKYVTISDAMRLVVLTGFMGAFTTFSTFIFDTGSMVRNAQWLPALVNVVGQVITGGIFLFFGARVAQYTVR